MRKYNVPIFIPHEGCGHDCVFCNQRKITGVESSVTPSQARAEMEEYLSTIKSEDCQIEIAFLGGALPGLAWSSKGSFWLPQSSFPDRAHCGHTPVHKTRLYKC